MSVGDRVRVRGDYGDYVADIIAVFEHYILVEDRFGNGRTTTADCIFGVKA